MRFAIVTTAMLATLGAAQECAGPLPASSFVADAGASWSVSGDVAVFQGPDNGIAYAPCVLGPSAVIAGEFRFLGPPGLAGLALGYRPGDATSTNPDYLVLVRSSVPSSPLCVYRITEPLGSSGLPAGAQLLGTCPSTTGTIHLDLIVALSPTELRIREASDVILSLPGDYSALLGNGRVAFVSFGQGAAWDDFAFLSNAFVELGEGCPGSNGMPQVFDGGSDPRVGGTLQFGFAGLPTHIASASFAMIGTPDALGPYSLLALGAECELQTIPFLIEPLPHVASPQWTAAIASDANLAGQSFIMQGLQIDLLANPLGITTTQALSFTVASAP